MAIDGGFWKGLCGNYLGYRNQVKNINVLCKLYLSNAYKNIYMWLLLRMPICTLFEPHGTNGLTAARISPNAKYIVTVGNEKLQNVYFWLWTYGRDKPDGYFNEILAISHLRILYLLDTFVF